MSKNRDIIIYVMAIPSGTVDSLRVHEKELGRKLRVMLLLDSKVRATKESKSASRADIVVSCDFSKPEKISEALLPYQDNLLAISCRSEQNMARFAQVIPHVPYLRTPSVSSLEWASDKYEMRKRFKVYDKKITPSFTLVKENSKKERARVAKTIGFPMVIKPTNLAASILVSICYHEEELEKTLRNSFRKIRKAYGDDNRLEQPKLIAEEYIEGDMYSVDSYVNSRGGVTHCPLVRVKTGRDIGHDDFYNYQQITPTALKSNSIANAHEVTEKAIHALGLRSTITHTELIKVDDEWKIVEVGARMGGFRHLLHELSCDINHALNDVLIRMPAKPKVPKKCKGYACAMKWFAAKEGIITEMKGIKKIEKLESFHSIKMNKKIGDRAKFAKNGGRSVFNLFLYNSDRSKLLADIRRVEKMVTVKVHK